MTAALQRELRHDNFAEAIEDLLSTEDIERDSDGDGDYTQFVALSDDTRLRSTVVSIVGSYDLGIDEVEPVDDRYKDVEMATMVVVR